MSEPTPSGPILRRTFGVETTRLRVLSVEEERRRRSLADLRPRRNAGLDARLALLGYPSRRSRLAATQTSSNWAAEISS